MGLTIYMVAQQLVLNYCRKARHFESLYFASVANNILWWTFVKACFNVVWGLIGGACAELSLPCSCLLQCSSARMLLLIPWVWWGAYSTVKVNIWESTSGSERGLAFKARSGPDQLCEPQSNPGVCLAMRV